jgi:hypothetical protein
MKESRRRLGSAARGISVVSIGWCALVPQGCFKQLDASDLDRDGEKYDWITIGDCRPDDAAIHPGQLDIPGNGIDEDCDGREDNTPDADGDGYDAHVDCNDDNAAQHSGLPEDLDNGLDDNCDGLVDTCHASSDCDGDGVSEANGDCDDHDPSVGGVVAAECETGLPGVCSDGSKQCVASLPSCISNTMSTQETCNGLDDDCDGPVDEDVAETGGACFVAGKLGECVYGRTECIGSQLQCLQLNEPVKEICNGLDDDCDGDADEDCPCQEGMDPPISCGTTDVGACQKGLRYCVKGNWGPCMGNIDPTSESCHDGLDGNCNGIVDSEDSECVQTIDLQDKLTLFPLTLTKGDNEFKGHGPDVNVRVYLTRDAGHIYVRACATATETEPDCTTGKWPCQIMQTISVTNAGVVDPDTSYEVNYRDSNHGLDDAWAIAGTQASWTNVCGAPRGGRYRDDAPFVTGVTCIGDTDGGDVCSDIPLSQGGCAGCTVYLDSVKIWRK